MISLLVQARSEATRRVAVTKSPYTIGSAPSSDLVLSDPRIEAFHAELHADAQGNARLSPRGKGISLNGTDISKQTELHGGDRIIVGNYTIVFQIKSGVPSRSNTQGEQKKVSSSPPSRQPPRTPSRPVVPKKVHAAQSPPKSKRYFSLQKLLHKELLESLDLKHMDLSRYSEDEMKKKSEETLKVIISRLEPAQFAGIIVSKLINDVIDQALGLGPLEELLKDEDITEIMVNNYDKIFVERKGKLSLSGAQFVDNAQVVEVIRRIIAPIGRRIDETNPMVDARLHDGSRVNAIIAPLAISGPSITIRKFSSEPFLIEDLIDFDSLSREMADFLHICVQYRKNICISGGTGSGKTTLLGVIASYIPEGDRIVTIEDAAELKLSQEHVVSLESKPPNIEGTGAIPIRKLVINSLRMRPDRIIVGECRGSEALDMLQAMNTGHDGSLTTLHANTCRDAIARLETMVMMVVMDLPAKAIREQVASAVDIIVQTNRFPDGTRKISSISAIGGIEGEKITLQEIFAYQQRGYDAEGKVLGEYVAEGGIPSFYRELQDRGIELDLTIFR